MTGLDKMISQILEEAQSLAKEKEAKAAQEADAIRAEAEQETKKQTEAIMKKAEQDVKDYQARLKSADEQKRRTALLAAKQEIIAEVIESAYQKFCSMEPGEYFETIRKMIGTYVLPQEGKILFSEKDLARMPESFPVELARIADERGLLFPKRREAWKADSSFCIMESKRTAHSEQSLTQRGMSFRTGYTRYYFFKQRNSAKRRM